MVPVETDSMACKVPQVLLSLPQPLARTVPTVWMVPLVPQPVLPQSQVVLEATELQVPQVPMLSSMELTEPQEPLLLECPTQAPTAEPAQMPLPWPTVRPEWLVPQEPTVLMAQLLASMVRMEPTVLMVQMEQIPEMTELTALEAPPMQSLALPVRQVATHSTVK